jgi:rRNA maturation endonuclease Nob1
MPGTCMNCLEFYSYMNLNFCPICGDELQYLINQGYTCVGCNEDVEEDWQYCGYCGIYLDWSDKDYVESEVH